VAVEKLAHSELAKIGSRQEALQTIFPSLLDIFYHPIFDFFQKNRVFQLPLLLSPPISKWDNCRKRKSFEFALLLAICAARCGPEADFSLNTH
jgi:hypothetical protein